MKVAICMMIKDTPDYLVRSIIKNYLEKGASDIYFIIDYESKPIYQSDDERVHYLNVKDIPHKVNNRSGMLDKLISVYDWFLKLYRKEYDWIAFFDDDEFIDADFSFLEHFKDERAVYIPWVNYLTKAVNSDKTDNFIENGNWEVFYYFSKRRTENFFYFCKSIINTKLCYTVQGVHLGSYAGVNINGVRFNPKVFNYQYLIEIAPVHLRHYYLRGFDEWCERIFNRGDIADMDKEWKLPLKSNHTFDEYFVMTGIPYTIENIEDLFSQIGLSNKEEILNSIKNNKDFFDLS